MQRWGEAGTAAPPGPKCGGRSGHSHSSRWAPRVHCRACRQAAAAAATTTMRRCWPPCGSLARAPLMSAPLPQVTRQRVWGRVRAGVCGERRWGPGCVQAAGPAAFGPAAEPHLPAQHLDCPDACRHQQRRQRQRRRPQRWRPAFDRGGSCQAAGRGPSPRAAGGPAGQACGGHGAAGA